MSIYRAVTVAVLFRRAFITVTSMALKPIVRQINRSEMSFLTPAYWEHARSQCSKRLEKRTFDLWLIVCLQNGEGPAISSQAFSKWMRQNSAYARACQLSWQSIKARTDWVFTPVKDCGHKQPRPPPDVVLSESLPNGSSVHLGCVHTCTCCSCHLQSDRLGHMFNTRSEQDHDAGTR